jgi:hypothetical protein
MNNPPVSRTHIVKEDTIDFDLLNDEYDLASTNSWEDYFEMAWVELTDIVNNEEPVALTRPNSPHTKTD